MNAAFDLVLASSLIGLALYVARVKDDESAIVGFIAFGLLLSLGWTRLASIDVALTETAIGSGVTGMLLLRAHAQLRDEPSSDSTSSIFTTLPIGIACAAVSAAIAFVVLVPPDPAPSLALRAHDAIAATGVGNPVTAVLMAYRAIDTLLEKVVLVLALIGVWSLASNSEWGGAPTQPAIGSPAPLVFLGRVLSPIGVLVAIYLLWVGADAPGGAFQGGAVLAAMWLLVMFSGLQPLPQTRDIRLRGLLVGGPMIFLAIGFLGIGAGAFLSYPPAFAKALIVLIEVALILSIAVTLALLVAGPSKIGPAA